MMQFVRETELALFDAGGIFSSFFKASNRSNYAIEAFTRQLAWSRTINTHGRAGKNVSCDLHMEHLNREAKNQISGLGSNITDAAVTRVGNALGEVVHVLHRFDCVNGIKDPSARHSKNSYNKDMAILVKQLHETSKVFERVSGRVFPNLKQKLHEFPCSSKTNAVDGRAIT